MSTTAPILQLGWVDLVVARLGQDTYASDQGKLFKTILRAS